MHADRLQSIRKTLAELQNIPHFPTSFKLRRRADSLTELSLPKRKLLLQFGFSFSDLLA